MRRFLVYIMQRSCAYPNYKVLCMNTLLDPAVTVLGLIMLNTCTSDIKNVNTMVVYSFLP